MLSQTAPPQPRSPIGLHPTLAWTAMLGFALFTTAGILAHAGGLLRLAYPAGAFLVGLFLFVRYPILYLGFTWWVAFLSPFVRRLIDFQSGWVDPSPVLLAPFLVMMVSTLTVIKKLPRSLQTGGLPLLLSITGVVYGFLVGLINQEPAAAIVALLNWLAPILLAFHLFVHWRNYPHYRQNIQRVFVWGVLVTGSYGVLQYLIAPEWDRFWLVNTGLLAFGTPEPMAMRVFSTMNSPGPFATVMMAGLLLLFSSQSVIRFPAGAAGYLSFLLSIVRSAWLGWVVGVMTFIPSLKPKLQMRLVVTIMVMAICVIPLINMEPFATTINARLQTFTNTEADVSYNDRLSGYTEILGEALSQIPGEGLGYVVRSDSLGANDSGILSMFFSLGWFGTLPYLGGIVLMFFSLFQSTVGRSDAFMSAARAISLGVFAQIGLGSATAALSGVVMWSFAGLALAAQRYYDYQQAQAIAAQSISSQFERVIKP
ncbi:O-antigen ligase domain-containing protein [Leptothermofonsia sichuanensis E412]|uniref:O-antigen ligase domain-containing protein n=1 Tax=Leptothermofonsia sichuanensis TaxID=2917832 RepID=UPI001CA5FE7E|nr:O-antigen ligase domain-containing protein [Leptothermofonsia sichuanensis]QZZ20063.1 O-antigen ligase domain-containing protein [Leptothermofonsia sichuanensis E412]